MKFVIFCEGYTEHMVIPNLFGRWLNPRLKEKVGFKLVRFNGWNQLVDDTPRKAKMYLDQKDSLGVISLLDLFGPTFYPTHITEAEARRQWGMKYMLDRVDHLKYRHHFAVHELEAWLLSQPEKFPPAVQRKLPGKVAQPELINFNEPPAKLLDRLYMEAFKKGYKKVVEGSKLFLSLDPEITYRKCPAFRALVDDLLNLCPESNRISAV